MLQVIQVIRQKSSASDIPGSYDAEIVVHANYEEEPLLAKIEKKLSELLKEKQKQSAHQKKRNKRKRKKPH